MSNILRRRGTVAAIVALLSLGLALGVVIVMKYLELPDDAVIVAVILLLPLFVYLTFSGSLEELRAPGGWLAKFKKTANESVQEVEMTPVKSIAVQEEQEVFVGPSEEELFQNPNALLLKMNSENKPVWFDLCGYLDYLEKLLALETVKYLISIDGSEKFLWLIPLNSVYTDPELKPVEGKCQVHQLMDWIYFGQFQKIAGMDGFVPSANAAALDWSKRRCLQEMHKRKLEALPVVENGRLIGLLERTRLVTSILVDISGNL